MSVDLEILANGDTLKGAISSAEKAVRALRSYDVDTAVEGGRASEYHAKPPEKGWRVSYGARGLERAVKVLPVHGQLFWALDTLARGPSVGVAEHSQAAALLREALREGGI